MQCTPSASKLALAPTDQGTRVQQRVLCVDDEPLYREVLRQLFASAGWYVEVANDGALAWEKIQRGRFDVLVTDHNMPNMTGLELVSKVRAADAVPRIIVHSAGLVPDVMRAYTSAAIDRVIRKGSPWTEIVAAAQIAA